MLAILVKGEAGRWRRCIETAGGTARGRSGLAKFRHNLVVVCLGRVRHIAALERPFAVQQPGARSVDWSLSSKTAEQDPAMEEKNRIIKV